jgi:hypothetical protein
VRPSRLLSTTKKALFFSVAVVQRSRAASPCRSAVKRTSSTGSGLAAALTVK